VKNKIIGLLLVSMAGAGWASSGVAELKGTAPNSQIKGTVRLEDTPAGLSVKAQVVNVPPGTHGFHIHEYGACDDMAKAAGGHYNPFNMNHGDAVKAGIHHAHAGDLGNVTVDASGTGQVSVVIPGLTLSSGTYTVSGRSIVLHEKTDDLSSQPAGNAGNRIACGAILVVGSGAK